MVKSVTFDMKAPYRPLESFIYDRFIAPSVIDFLERVEEQFDGLIPEKGRLLDVGCGGGQVAIALAGKHPRLRITGLDISPEQIERAQKRAASLEDRLDFVRGSALDLPFEDESFDGVLSVASLKHWPDQSKGLAECIRVLRSGGALVVIEADRSCRFEDAREFVGRWRIPGPVRVPALLYFRTFVAGQSVDLEEARQLLSAMPLLEKEVRRLPETPALLLQGRKK